MTTAASSAGTPAKPSGGFELWSWFFMRLSGLVLLGLALGHLVIMHLLHNVDAIDYNFVAARYAGWFWRGYDGLMLTLAMFHGTNGMRILIDDYIHPPGRRRAAMLLLHLLSTMFLVMGLAAIIVFKPVVR